MIRQWIVVLVMVLLMTAGCSEEINDELAQVDQAEEVNEEVVEPETVEERTEHEASVEDIEEAEETHVATSEEEVEEVTTEVSQKDEDAAEDTEEQSDGTTDVQQEVAGRPLGNVTQVDEVRAIWLSYLDLQSIFMLDSETSYREALSEIITTSQSLGLNTIMYQVRPFGDALYPSEFFPSSYIVTGSGNEGKEMLYDPFGIAVEMAQENGLRIEAWINPYRIRTSTSVEPLMAGGNADVWLNDGSRRALQASDGTLVYNPSNEEVRELILAGVKEIIDAYPIDGIHFDDYFYPTSELSFDEIEYLGFLHDNDALSHDEWRRVNVNSLIAQVYEVVQMAERPIVFGISPYGDIDANYNQLYADVSLWASEPGYVDYLIPQIYFGFMHDQYPYSEILEEWYALSDGQVKIMPGIAVYKVGREDKWAGEGQTEWIESEDILAQMIIDARSNEGYAGFALFRYDSVFNPPEELSDRMLTELEALKKVLIN